jgi:hypothetical protein
MMTVLWLLLEVAMLLFYKNLNESDHVNNENRADERTPLVDNQTPNETIRINVVDNVDTGPWLRRLYDEYLYEEVIAVFLITFTSFFIQTSLEVSKILFFFRK